MTAISYSIIFVFPGLKAYFKPPSQPETARWSPVEARGRNGQKSLATIMAALWTCRVHEPQWKTQTELLQNLVNILSELWNFDTKTFEVFKKGLNIFAQALHDEILWWCKHSFKTRINFCLANTKMRLWRSMQLKILVSFVIHAYNILGYTLMQSILNTLNRMFAIRNLPYRKMLSSYKSLINFRQHAEFSITSKA